MLVVFEIEDREAQSLTQITEYFRMRVKDCKHLSDEELTNIVIHLLLVIGIQVAMKMNDRRALMEDFLVHLADHFRREKERDD